MYHRYGGVKLITVLDILEGVEKDYSGQSHSVLQGQVRIVYEGNAKNNLECSTFYRELTGPNVSLKEKLSRRILEVDKRIQQFSIDGNPEVVSSCEKGLDEHLPINPKPLPNIGWLQSRVNSAAVEGEKRMLSGVEISCQRYEDRM